MALFDFLSNLFGGGLNGAGPDFPTTGGVLYSNPQVVPPTPATPVPASQGPPVPFSPVPAMHPPMLKALAGEPPTSANVVPSPQATPVPSPMAALVASQEVPQTGMNAMASAGGHLPRGIRNNNFGNIEDGSFARSLPGYVGSDGRFARFANPEAGWNAMSQLIGRYGHQGIHSIQGIINKWAPTSDGNNVSAYAGYVGRGVGIDPSQRIDLSDTGLRAKIAEKMAEFENGKSMINTAAQQYMRGQYMRGQSNPPSPAGFTPAVPTAPPTDVSTQSNDIRQIAQSTGLLSKALGLSPDTAAGIRKLLGTAGVSLMAINNPQGASALARANASEGSNDKWQVIRLPTGKLLRVNAKTGQIQDLGDYGADKPTLGLQPVYGKDANGNTVLLQLNNKGATASQVVTPPGVTIAEPYKVIETPTDAYLSGAKTGTMGPVIHKDVQGAAEQKAEGTKQGDYQGQKPQLFRKAEGALRSFDSQATTVGTAIDKALSQIDQGAAGGYLPVTGIGAAADAVPGTNAYNLAQTLNTIKSNVGFKQLQEMRQNSPTGGALGQVSDYENKLTQAVSGSMEQGQSAEQLKANLLKVKKAYQDLQQYLHGAFQKDFGDMVPSRGTLDTQPQQPQAQPSGGIAEGVTAVNPQTGQRIIFKDGKWQAM